MNLRLNSEKGFEVDGEAAALGHEVHDATVRPIVLTGVALAVLTAIVALITYAMFRYLASRPGTVALPNPLAGTSLKTPGPHVEEHPQIEFRQLRAQEDSTLSTYGWMDKTKGVVRIPIERAMELQLQRGFPVRKPANEGTPR